MVAQNLRIQGKHECLGSEKDRWYESSFLHIDSEVGCDVGYEIHAPPVVQW